MSVTIVLFVVNALLGMLLTMIGFVVKRLHNEVDMLRKKVDDLNKELPQNYSTKGDMKYMIDLLIEKMDRWEMRVEKLIDKIDQIKTTNKNT